MSARVTPSRAGEPTSQILELRRYTLHPRRRHELIEVFDRWLVRGQEAVGMRIVGQFADVDDDDAFVWLRGFTDMSSRTRALTEFYGGPVWAAHREAANATMIDWTDVVLLHPLCAERSLPAGPLPVDRHGLVELVVVPLPGPLSASARATVAAATADALAVYESEHAPNGFPALPVRDAEVLVVLGATGWSPPAAVEALADGALRRMRLRPTPGSRWSAAGAGSGAAGGARR